MTTGADGRYRPRLSGRHAVVTGAASGIGRAIADRFIAEGASVLAVDLQPIDIQNASAPGVVPMQADVTDETSIRAVFAEASMRWGAIDALVNSAGIAVSGTPLVDVAVEQFQRVLTVNVVGTFLAMKHAIPLLAPRRGAIINLASIASLVAQPGAVGYMASKGAVLSMTRAAALECAPFGVRVNAICPGTVDTPLVRRGLPPDEISRLEQLHPAGRLGRPEEIAAMAVFLASDECTFATGAPFIVDGGRTAW